MSNLNTILSAMACFVTENNMLNVLTIRYHFGVGEINYCTKYKTYHVSTVRYGKGDFGYAETEEDAINLLNSFLEKIVQKNFQLEFEHLQWKIRSIDSEIAELG